MTTVVSIDRLDIAAKLGIIVAIGITKQEGRGRMI